MNRREFLSSLPISALAAATMGGGIRASAQGRSPKQWPIGCFNRPWGKWGLDVALDGIKAAGYPVAGLLMRSKADPIIGPEATPEYLDTLRKRVASRGLKANLGTIFTRQELGWEKARAQLHQQIDNAATLKLEWLMNFGVDKPEEYELYYKLMADASAYAAERGPKLVLKPHGGGSGAAEEILRCIKKINHPNFSIWYDAGNIIHYTGKDPVSELEPIARHVTGFCAKDCAQIKGDVMIQFGTGKVDFTAVFAKLKSAGFQGPIMVECAAPAETSEEVTGNARANREFLERTLAGI